MKFSKRNFNQNWVDLYFNAFFASLFHFANLGNFLNDLQFYESGSTCFFIILRNFQSEILIKIGSIWILMHFSLHFFASQIWEIF